MTFSLVARDPRTGELGAATATAGPVVGALVIHGQAGVGAIATQAMTNPRFGDRGLALLAHRLSATETLRQLLAEDASREQRQLLIMDASGIGAHWSGSGCGAWHGGLAGENLVVGGNLLTCEGILPAVQQTFIEHPMLPLAERMLAALKDGAALGGDRRGIRSAALKVWHQRHYADIDIRADWSQSPLDALTQVLAQVRHSDYADFFRQLPP